MLTIKVKIKEKDDEKSTVELVQPSAKELENASKNEKNVSIMVYNTISDALKNMEQ